MKRINKYIDSLYVYNYIKPNISIKYLYDKLIINGNNYNKNRYYKILCVIRKALNKEKKFCVCRLLFFCFK